MTAVFRLPDLGEGLTEAEIVHWLVAEGDLVAVDQEVVTVETAKAAVDVPCPYAGRVTSLHGAPGATVAVGAPLITVEVVVGAGSEQYRSEERAGAPDPALVADSPQRPLIGYGAGEGPARRDRSRRAAAPPPSAPPPQRAGAVKVISPLVRRLAMDAGVDLAAVAATGPAGVIRRADVEAAAAGSGAGRQAGVPSPAPAAPPRPGDQRIPITGTHRVMVDRLSTSRREVPDATTWVDVDASGLVQVRDALRKSRPDDGIGVLALMARIVVAGLRRYPVLNSSVDVPAGEIRQHGAVNLGFAAQSPRGLVVPVVPDAAALTTAELAAALHELTGLAREGRLTPAQLSGGTFTLNNYGVFGVDGSTPIINHPEAAMLGIGRIIDKPWVVDGALAVRKVTQLSFTFDHRVCDGGTAGGFLRYVADCVESPAVLLGDL